MAAPAQLGPVLNRGIHRFTAAALSCRSQDHRVTRLRRQILSILLNTAALCLSAVGVAINGWFARSLGSSEFAGWLFLALGVAADLIALAMPSCAANLWQARQRRTALVGWSLWLVTFIFIVTAGLGFASTNVIDVTLARASRLTPAVTAAHAALDDAMAARDRECKGGVGKFCREREATPWSGGRPSMVQWRLSGRLRILKRMPPSRSLHGPPSAQSGRLAILRLVLLALLPQIGGLLILIAGRSATAPACPAS